MYQKALLCSVAAVAVLAILAYSIPGAGVSTLDTPRVEDELDGSLLNGGTPVIYFFDRGCPDCEEISRELLPRYMQRNGLEERHVQRLDVANERSISILLALEKKLSFEAKSLAPVIIVHGRAFPDVESFRKFVLQGL